MLAVGTTVAAVESAAGAMPVSRGGAARAAASSARRFIGARLCAGVSVLQTSPGVVGGLSPAGVVMPAHIVPAPLAPVPVVAAPVLRAMALGPRAKRRAGGARTDLAPWRRLPNGAAQPCHGGVRTDFASWRRLPNGATQPCRGGARTDFASWWRLPDGATQPCRGGARTEFASWLKSHRKTYCLLPGARWGSQSASPKR